MTNNSSRCPHVATIGQIDKEDYFNAIRSEKCSKCQIDGTHLWLCLREGCLFIGCGSGKEKNNHSGDHEKEKAHPLQFNLTSKRIWCFVCNQEVFSNNYPAFQLPFLSNSMDSNEGKSPLLRPNQSDKCFEPTLFELEHSDSLDFTRGLAGLYNLGNSCYMNSALQALSNCTPLTSYFLDCIPHLIKTNANGDSSPTRSNGKLVKAYAKFIQSMWVKQLNGRQNPIINPSSIAAEIRSINPSFRSYSQQDVQEFLRCFMDELHSQMKLTNSPFDDKHRSESSSSSNSEIPLSLSNLNLESEYETCTSDVDGQSQSDGEKNVTFFNEMEEYAKKQTKSLSRSDSGVSLNTNQKLVTKRKNLPLKNYFPSRPSKSSVVLSSSIISSIFDGKIVSQIECLTCNRRSTTIETFQDLSLPIPSREQLQKFHSIQIGNDEQLLTTSLNQQNNEHNADQSWIYWFYSTFKSFLTFNLWGPSLTLQDCLQAFFQADELTGDNMYSCEKCGKLRNGMKYCRVIQLPEVLCIHLKRFRHDSMIYTKIGSYVSFPLVDLDMKPFLHKDCKNEVLLYDLFSCIVHYGRAGSGHYITYSLNNLNQQWYEYDDENIRQVDPNTVQNAEAYVLFYRKKESTTSETYEQIRHLLSRDEDYLLPFYISRSWINRFFYFAEPGPINNNDFLCKHGGVLPSNWSVINELVCAVPQSVWLLLYEKYGGSVGCNILYPCTKCQLEEENLKCRQREEKSRFLQLKRSEKESDAIYALNPTWYRDWENFVCEKSSEAPGPVSNTSISTTKNGVTRLIRRDCNYFQVSESIWNYLYEIYGGGPELLIRTNSNVDEQSNATGKPSVTSV